jgi:hypothetical protein
MFCSFSSVIFETGSTGLEITLDDLLPLAQTAQPTAPSAPAGTPDLIPAIPLVRRTFSGVRDCQPSWA